MALEILINGVDQVSKLVYQTLRIEQRADAFVSTCSLQLVDEAASLVIEEKQSLVIQDGATKYFAGVVANIQATNMAEGTSCLLHTIEGQDYNILVEEVVIDQLEEYAAVQDSTIIDDLFDKYLPEINSHTPGAGGYVQSLHIFAEISFENITLREALDRIATEVESTALSGYWYIDFDKYLHYFNVEDNAPAWTLSDTPDNVNSFDYLSAVGRDRQGAAIVNRILIWGADLALFVQDYDSYAYYGKWFEAVVRDNTLLSVEEIREHGFALLGKWAYPDEVFDVTTRKDGLRAGMNIELDCSLFGTADRINRILNPSFEINVTDGWAFGQDGAGGSAAQSGVRASVGNFSCLLTASNAGNAYQHSNNIAVADGETITAQVRVYRTSDISSDIAIYDATTLITRATLSTSLTDTWELLTISWKNDTGGAVIVLVFVRNKEGDGSSQIWFDACAAEKDKGPKPLIYIDGTLPYCSWDGVAHNSISRRRPVFMVKQLTLTWPENTPTYALSLGGNISQTALIKARRSEDELVSGGGPVTEGQLPLASRGWTHNLVFSATDHDTVAWALGTLNTAANQTFSIVAGNTGNMAAVTYVYLDTDTSLTVLQTTVTASGAVGSNMILIAVCRPRAAGLDATFLVFGGEGHNVLVDTANIADDAVTANQILANTITAGEIAANTITATEILANTITANEILANSITAGCLNVGTLSAITANMGTLTAGVIQTAAAGNNRVIINMADGIRGINAANVIQFQLDPSDGKAYAGAGAVVLDSAGLRTVATAAAGTPQQLRLRYESAGTEYTMGQVYSDWAGGAAPMVTWVTARRMAGSPWPTVVRVYLAAIDDIAATDVRLRVASDGYVDVTDYLRVGSGLYVGSTAGVPTDNDIICQGTIKTAKGHDWDLGHYWSGAVTAEGRIDVSIDGTGYWLLARYS